MAVIALERHAALTKGDGFTTQRGFEYIEDLNRQVNQSEVDTTSSGSPEGVVTGSPGKLYMDTAGTAGSILYVKKTGSGNTGWILV